MSIKVKALIGSVFAIATILMVTTGAAFAEDSSSCSCCKMSMPMPMPMPMPNK